MENNTRIALISDNLARSAAGLPPSVINTVAGQESAEYPQTNALEDDRYLVWECPAYSAAVDATLALDFGDDVEVFAVGIFNFVKAGTGWPNQWRVQSSPDGTTWTNVNTNRMVALDSMLTGFSPRLARYFRLVFPVGVGGTPGFTLGKVFLGTVTDMLCAYGPDSSEVPVLADSRVRAPGGREFVTVTGPTRRRFDLRFPSATKTVRDLLDSVARAQEGFYLHAPDSAAYEARAVPDSFAASARWRAVGSTTELWRCEVAVESLP